MRLKCLECGNHDDFYRYVVDLVSVDAYDGDTTFEDCMDSDMLKEGNQGIFCAQCQGQDITEEEYTDGQP